MGHSTLWEQTCERGGWRRPGGLGVRVRWAGGSQDSTPDACKCIGEQRQPSVPQELVRKPVGEDGGWVKGVDMECEVALLNSGYELPPHPSLGSAYYCTSML